MYAAGLLLATGLVAEWGAWYSTSLPYRAQTEALLHADRAVSRSVAALKFDHTWSEHGVHQVWGLGVPLWRLPFEAAAKLIGYDGFPDRLAFGLFALLVSFVVLKVWVGLAETPGSAPASKGGRGFPETASPGTPNSRSASGDTSSDGWQLVAGFGAGFIILLLFPPFLTLLQVRGAVWEEAVAYEYLFAILLVSLLITSVRRPTIGRVLLVCALAGLGGLIRPTLVFYGFATVVLATLVWVFKAGPRPGRAEAARRLLPPGREPEALLAPSLSSSIANGGEGGRRPGEEGLASHRLADRLETSPALGPVLTPALLGLLLFCLGGGVLWLTNLKRFGDGFEFGHKLNVQYLYGSMHATRFDDPFQDEPLTGAAKELFGALFLANKFNGADWYQENIFPGQSPTVRWREFYFRTYDWSYLPLLLLGWAAAIAAGLGSRVWRLGDRRSELGRSKVLPRVPPAVGAPNSDSARHALGDSRTLITLGAWSLLAALPLASFYLYAPVISSRYLMDLAPAFASAIAAAWLFVATRCERRWSRVLACVLLCTWLGVELYLSRSVYGGPASVTAAELKVLRESRPAPDGGTNT